MNNTYSFDNYQPAPQYNSSRNQFPPFSNVIFVNSLEEALRMPARMHSEMVYWNRHKDEIYRIYTDYTNGKQYMILDVKLHQQKEVSTETSTTSEVVEQKVSLEELMTKLNALEKQMEVLNEKHNVDTNAGTDIPGEC